MDEAACDRVWAQRREFSYSLRDTGLTKLNEDVVVPRGRLAALVDFCESLQIETGIPIACFGHAGDGNIHVNLMVGDMTDASVAAPAEAALDRLFHFVIGIGGAITGEHGIGLPKPAGSRKRSAPVLSISTAASNRRSTPAACSTQGSSCERKIALSYGKQTPPCFP